MGSCCSQSGKSTLEVTPDNRASGSVVPGGVFQPGKISGSVKPAHYNASKRNNLSIGATPKAQASLPGKPTSPRKNVQPFVIAPKVSPLPAGADLESVPWPEQLDKNYCERLNLSRWKGKRAASNPLSLIVLSERLANNVSMTELYLARNDLEDSQIELLASGLQKNHVLKKLCLDFNKISSVGANALALSLEMNSSLTYLDLSNNALGDDGAEALAALVGCDNCMLTVLSLNANGIATKGAVALANALKMRPNPRLDSLSLNLNKGLSSPEAVTALTTIFDENTRIVQFFINKSGLSLQDSVFIKRRLRRNMNMAALRPQKIAFLLGLRARLAGQPNTSTLHQLSKSSLYDPLVLDKVWKFMHN